MDWSICVVKWVANHNMACLRVSTAALSSISQG
ncbi:Uncharacterised protein [Vibrio cholerae]|nr:Uncharacterised protein [Vibrio cholerae]CSI83105.1 Uncharacterised protein [Vibrio cholerae]